MSRFALLACAVVLVACAKAENMPASDSSAATAMAPVGVSVADFAGTWTVRALPETGDSALVTYELMATADTTSWMMHLPDGQALPVRILSVSGDSIMTEVGPYNSALRKGVKVTTNTTSRLQNGMMVGTFVAHYQTAGADSVLRGRLEGTKKP